MNDIIQLNINNLTSLWQKVSIPFKGFFSNKAIDYSSIQNSDWPNRIWFTENVNEIILHEAIEIINNTSPNLSVTCWSGFENTPDRLFEKAGFKKKSEQTGMSLLLKKKFDLQNRLNFKIVSDQVETQIWTTLFLQCFGYTIAEAILTKTLTGIQYYLVYFQQKPIGTAIVFKTGNTVGIHGVGVIPEMRRKGFAEEIMAYILNTAIDEKIATAVLQSSALGNPIYLKMGFSEDFLMTNYVLPRTIVPLTE